MHHLDRLVDLFLPPRCGGCGRLGGAYCADCIRSTRRLEEPLCRRCGRELAFARSHCSCHLRHADRLISAVAMEGPVERAMHRFKYLGWRRLAVPFAALLGERLAGAQLGVELAVAVPLHRSRERRRGFNQAELLRRELSRQTGLREPPGRLIRWRHAPPQVGLDRQHRLQNLVGAFCWQGESLKRVPVIVVDDVSTTGATVDACAQALKEGGAGMVIGLTVARVASY